MGQRHFQRRDRRLLRRYRRGFPPAVVDSLVAALELGNDDVVADLGCGTGQLTLPLAERVRAVVGMDPEPDMLARARSIAAEREVTNVGWLLGTDVDLPVLRTLLGDGGLGGVTIATTQRCGSSNRSELPP